MPEAPEARTAVIRAVVVQRRDRVPEEVLDPVARGVVQELGEFAAEDLDVPAGDAATELVQVDRDRPLAVAVQNQLLGPRAGFVDGVAEAHPVDHLDGGTEQVDRVAAEPVPQFGRAFDDGDLESVPLQPVGQHWTRHARAGDQHLLHVAPLEEVCLLNGR